MKKRLGFILIILILVSFLNTSYAAPIIPNVINVAPSADVLVQKTKTVELVFLTDYSGAKLNSLISKVNEIKAALLPLGVNIKSHILNTKISIAKQNNLVVVNSYSRFFRANYLKTGRQMNPGQPTIYWSNTPESYLVTYESITCNEGQDLPPFSKSNSYTAGTKELNVGYQGMGFAYIHDDYYVYDPNNMAATKVDYSINTQMSVYTGYYHAFTYTAPTYSLDNTWSLTSMSSQQQSNDVYAVDLSKLNTLPLKSDSEKYMLFVSDAGSANYSLGWGKSFCFGNASSNNLGSFIMENNFSIYTVADASLQNLILDKTVDRLDRLVPQNKSLNNLMSLSNGDVQYYEKGNVNKALDCILSKYSSCDHNGSVNILVSTDYTGSKLTGLTNTLNSLKAKLAQSEVTTNYTILSGKKVVDTVTLTNSKLEMVSGNRVLLKSDKSLWLWKGNNGYNILSSNMIFNAYPFAASRFQPYYSSYDRRTISSEEQMNNSYIPPLKISDNVIDVAGGSYYDICYIKSDGTAWYLGYHYTYPNYSYVHQKIASFTNVKRVFKTDGGFMFIKTDGSLWGMASLASLAWDYSNAPQNVKDSFNNLVPVKVRGLDGIAIKDFSYDPLYKTFIALSCDGSAYSWGNGSYGQLGDGSKSSTVASGGGGEWHDYNSYYPHKLNISNIIGIAASDRRCYFLTNMGTVYMTGYVGKEGEFTYIKKTNEYYHYYWYDYQQSKHHDDILYYSSYPTIFNNNGNILTNFGAIKNTCSYSNYGDISIFNKSGDLLWSNYKIRDLINNNTNSYIANYLQGWEYTAQRNKLYSDAANAIAAIYNGSNQNSYLENAWGCAEYVILNGEGKITDIKMSSSSNSTLTSKFGVTYDSIENLMDGSSTLDIYSMDTGVLQSVPISENSDKYLIYVSDTIGSYADNTNYLSMNSVPDSFLNYLNDNGFKFLCLTPYANYKDISFNKLLGANGISPSLAKLTQSIVNKYTINIGESGVLYLIAGEDGLYYGDNLFYSDFENDPKYSDSWKFTHNENYFENSNGKYIYSGKWVSAPAIMLDKVGKYDVIYKVRDNPKNNNAFDNYRLWSNENCKFAVYVHRRPIANFSVNLNKSGSNFISQVNNLSYDLDHTSKADRGIKQSVWQWKYVSDASWSDGLWPSTLSANKQYQLKLVVQDIEGALSKPYIYTIDTSSVNLPPSVDANPQSYIGSAPLNVTVTADDKGENDFLRTDYVWTHNTSMPASWTSKTTKTFVTSPPGDGTWYLHMKVFDTSGNSYYRYRGVYTINSLQITGVTVAGYWNHWRGQVDMFGKQLTNEPNRFLSYEKVKITVNTTGNPDRIEIAFSPELQSMSFTDINGHVYNYADEIGYTVNFPYQITVTGNQSTWEYILPLANSTKDWNDTTLKSPYWMQVKAYKGAAAVTYDLPGGINITGNVFDLTYIQPVQ